MNTANPISTIGDVIRGSLIAERPEQIRPLLESVIEQVKAQGGKLFVKNFWAQTNPSLGYVGVHIRIRLPILSENTNERKFILMELQLHLKAIMDGTADCAKEIAHHLYKPEEPISPEIISCSQLIYLTAMTRLLTPQTELKEADNTVQLLQAMTKSDTKKSLAMATAQLLKNSKLGLGDWNEQFQAVVPRDWDAVAQEWKNTAEKVNTLLNLPPIDKDASYPWTNTATSIEELYADVNKIAPVFRRMCQTAVYGKPGCDFNFGPNNAYMQKEPKSLRAKIKKDRDEALKPFLTQLMKKIGRDWPLITESVPFSNFSEIKRLDFSHCQLITDTDLDFLQHFSSLEILDISECSQLTDKGLTHLKGLNKLKCLNLSSSNFTDQGLKHLWPLRELESLNRMDCQITEVGLAQAGLQKLLLSNPPTQPMYPSQSSQTAPRSTKSTFEKKTNDDDFSEPCTLPPKATASHPSKKENPLDIATHLTSSGNAFYYEKKYNEARKKYAEAFTIRRAALGEYHPDVAASLNNIGNCYYYQGNYAEALKKYTEVFTIRRAALGPNHPDVAASLRNIGFCYYYQGDYDEARKKHAEALTIRRVALEKNHPDIAKSLTCIGNCYYDQGNYDEARKKYAEALEIQKAALGENHPDVAKNLHDIGDCYYAKNNSSSYALCNYVEALKIQKATLEKNHPDIAKSLTSIGNYFYARSNYEEARKKYAEALKIQRTALGENHPDVAASLHNIGDCYNSEGNLIECLKVRAEAHAIQKPFLEQTRLNVTANKFKINPVFSAPKPSPSTVSLPVPQKITPQPTMNTMVGGSAVIALAAGVMSIAAGDVFHAPILKKIGAIATIIGGFGTAVCWYLDSPIPPNKTESSQAPV